MVWILYNKSIAAKVTAPTTPTPAKPKKITKKEMWKRVFGGEYTKADKDELVDDYYAN